MGQKVKMDEYEGGVRPPVLYSLAEPLRNARSRQGGRVSVHCVKAGDVAELCCCGLIDPALPSYWQDLNEHELLYIFFHSWIFPLIDISGCSAVSYHIVKVHLFLNNLPPFILLFPSWCCSRKLYKEKKYLTPSSNSLIRST